MINYFIKINDKESYFFYICIELSLTYSYYHIKLIYIKINKALLIFSKMITKLQTFLFCIFTFKRNI